MADPWTLLALPPLDAGLLEAFFADLDVRVVAPAERTREEVDRLVADAELVLGDWTGALSLTAAQVSLAPRLTFVQQPSVGVDSLDVEALTAAGVPVANTAGVNAVSVAEWCIGAAFCVLRSLHHADAAVRAGRWPQLELAQRGGGELAGRRVGIVGMGAVGVACATRFAALGAEVAHWSRRPRTPEEAGGSRWMPYDELVARSDLLVLVVPLADETRGLVGAAQLAAMPQGSYVIDAARGGVLDEDALLAAVQGGPLAGAALDVFASEPLQDGSPLRAEDRILLSPHAGGATPQAQGRLVAAVIDNMRRASTGEPVHDVVNGLDPVIRRREA